MAIYNPFQRLVPYPEQEKKPENSRIYIPVPSANCGNYVQHRILSAPDAIAEGWRFVCKDSGRLRITHYRGTERNITVPYQIGERRVNELGNGAFRGTDISTVMLPDSVRKIRENCFQDSKVRKIFFYSGGNTLTPGLEEIPPYFAAGCENLEEIILPCTVRSIGERAFFCCKKLKFISLPYYCRTVASFAFARSGLEGFGFAHSPYYLQAEFDGTALEDTPLDKNSELVLLADPKKCQSYQIALVGWLAHKINIPAKRVYFSRNSILSRKNWLKHINLSACTDGIHGLEDAFQYTRNWNGEISFEAPGEAFNLIFPQGAKGYYVVPGVRTYLADSSRYNRYLTEVQDTDEKTVLYLHGDRLYSCSVQYKKRNIAIRSEKGFVFEQHAVSSRQITHISFDNIRADRCKSNIELFHPRCDNIQTVCWGKNKVCLPPPERMYRFEHEELLKAFCTYDTGKPCSTKFFDSRIFDRIFTGESCRNIAPYYVVGSDGKSRLCYKKKVVRYRFSQRLKLMMAVGVLQSTPELFPQRAMYADYLRTHKSYALRLCKKHRLPEEYETFLRSYYEVKP